MVAAADWAGAHGGGSGGATAASRDAMLALLARRKPRLRVPLAGDLARQQARHQHRFGRPRLA